MLFDPAPKDNCKLCNSEGYTISQKGEYAFATQCLCVPKCMMNEGTSARLRRGEIGLTCEQCQTFFPIIDETPLLVSDLPSWFQSQATMLLLRTDLPSSVYDVLLQMPSPLREAQKQLYRYLSAPKSRLHQWVEEKLERQRGSIVDLGCGVGLHERRDILGVELNWTLLQRYPGAKLVADILNPPFSPKSMDCILLLNVLDSCRVPFLLLQQVDALLRDGGTLLFSSPFAWNDAVTEPKEQVQPEWVRLFWEQRGYTVEEEECEWFVQGSPRSCTRYQTLAWEIYKKEYRDAIMGPR